MIGASTPGWFEVDHLGDYATFRSNHFRDGSKKTIMAELSNNHRIDYVEFSVGDIARSRNFYGKAFGWSFKDYGPGYCEFSDGRLTGGFTLDGGGNPGGTIKRAGALVILYAGNLAETQRRIEEAGGSIVKPAYAFPGGRRFHFTDPDGYELAVWSDK